MGIPLLHCPKEDNIDQKAEDADNPKNIVEQDKKVVPTLSEVPPLDMRYEVVGADLGAAIVRGARDGDKLAGSGVLLHLLGAQLHVAAKLRVGTLDTAVLALFLVTGHVSHHQLHLSTDRCYLYCVLSKGCIKRVTKS